MGIIAVGNINAHVDGGILEMFLRATKRINCWKKNKSMVDGVSIDDY